MGRLIRTARAEEDLIEIWMYIAADNPAAADRLLDQIDAKCQMLADNPRLGQARPDIAASPNYALPSILVETRSVASLHCFGEMSNRKNLKNFKFIGSSTSRKRSNDLRFVTFKVKTVI